MKRAGILAVARAFVSVWVVLAAGLTAVWLTDEVRVVGLVMLPTAIVASLLVLYFDWRPAAARLVQGTRSRVQVVSLHPGTGAVPSDPVADGRGGRRD